MIVKSSNYYENHFAYLIIVLGWMLLFCKKPRKMQQVRKEGLISKLLVQVASAD